MTDRYPSASVVIPTFNRLEDLKGVVRALRGQSVPESCRLEIVIVDDGSTDATANWLRRERQTGDLTVISQPNAGPAVARNRGARVASGDVLLFLGDDTRPDQGWLCAHLEEHRLHGDREGALAVVGYTGFPASWDSPFLRYINEQGAQFGYELIRDPLAVPFNFFYTSNVSLPRVFFLDLGGFREDFSAAAWEDIEFAYRGSQRGLRIHYQPTARTVHHHRVRPGTFRRRQRTSGRAAAVFASLHPELGDFLGVARAGAVRPTRGWRMALLRSAIAVGEVVPGLVPPSAYQRYLDQAYLEGLAAALHDPPP